MEEVPEQDAWAAVLWELCGAKANLLGGSDIVYALQKTSEEIWNAGLDDTFRSYSHESGDFSVNSALFDIGWLTVFLLKLQASADRKEQMKFEDKQRKRGRHVD